MGDTWDEKLRPCPECGHEVEMRRTDMEAMYPGALVWRGFQVKRGPKHARRCRHYRSETPS